MDLKVVLYLPMLVSASGFVEIENAVPRDPVNGFYGEAAILPCTFPLESFRDLSGTTITWQRELAVVHSFYYSQDQLDRQNVQYVNRTTLFIHEIERGNASLRLNSLTLQDSGEYTCYISTHSGSKKKSVLLSVTALYSEPRLQFFMLKTEVSVLVTSEGGFPFPTVQWLIENSEVTMWNETEMRQDTNTGMIFVSSRINLTDLTNSSLTFVLHNHHTGQHIRREIQLYSVTDTSAKQRQPRYFISLIVLLLLVMVIVVLFVLTRRRKKMQSKSISCTETGCQDKIKTILKHGSSV